MKIYSILLLFLLGAHYTFACTSAVISRSRTATGEVILWKNRDSSTQNTEVTYHTGGKYAYVALTNADDGSTYGGMNSQGLGLITNTVSNLYTVETSTGASRGTHPYSLVLTGLRTVTTVDDFEDVIKNYLPRKTGYQSIVGACDAQGGAAFFEINDTSYVRYDAQATSAGYVIRSNFGFSGLSARSTSERRYNLMVKQFKAHYKPFTVQDFVNYSRSFMTENSGNILDLNSEYIDANYTVPRYTTCGEIVVVSGPNPRIFISNGNPMAGMLIPVYVGGTIPSCLGANSSMYLASQEYLKQAYYKNSNNKTCLNKTLAKKIQAITYNVADIDPVTKPDNTATYAEYQDSIYTEHVLKIWNALGVKDLNGDGTMNVGDLTLLVNMIMESYNQPGAKFQAADLNEDGVINVGDITKLVATIMEQSKAFIKNEKDN